MKLKIIKNHTAQSLYIVNSCQCILVLGSSAPSASESTTRPNVNRGNMMGFAVQNPDYPVSVNYIGLFQPYMQFL